VCCETYFDILNRLGVIHVCDRQTDRRADGRTDIMLAHAALHNDARSKMQHNTVKKAVHSILNEHDTFARRSPEIAFRHVGLPAC